MLLAATTTSHSTPDTVLTHACAAVGIWKQGNTRPLYCKEHHALLISACNAQACGLLGGMCCHCRSSASWLGGKTVVLKHIHALQA